MAGAAVQVGHQLGPTERGGLIALLMHMAVVAKVLGC